jgi:hypothetical protein
VNSLACHEACLSLTAAACFSKACFHWYACRCPLRAGYPGSQFCCNAYRIQHVSASGRVVCHQPRECTQAIILCYTRLKFRALGVQCAQQWPHSLEAARPTLRRTPKPSGTLCTTEIVQPCVVQRVHPGLTHNAFTDINRSTQGVLLSNRPIHMTAWKFSACKSKDTTLLACS